MWESADRGRDSGAVQLGQLLPKSPFGFAQFFRDLDLGRDIEIAATPGSVGQPAIAQTETLARLGAGRDFETAVAFQGRHLNFCAERDLPRLERGLVNEVVTFNRKIRMTRQAHA